MGRGRVGSPLLRGSRDFQHRKVGDKVSSLVSLLQPQQADGGPRRRIKNDPGLSGKGSVSPQA